MISRMLSRATAVTMIAFWLQVQTKEVVLSRHDPMDVGYAWFGAWLFMTFTLLVGAWCFWELGRKQVN